MSPLSTLVELPAFMHKAARKEANHKHEYPTFCEVAQVLWIHERQSQLNTMRRHFRGNSSTVADWAACREISLSQLPWETLNGPCENNYHVLRLSSSRRLPRNRALLDFLFLQKHGSKMSRVFQNIYSIMRQLCCC